MICLSCHSLRLQVEGYQDAGICQKCRLQLPAARSGSPAGCSLFEYSGLLRRLILRVKVTGDLAALRLLCDLFATHPLTHTSLQKAASVMVVPSSLWGRVKGRIDLAWCLGHRVASEHKLPLRTAPGRLFWKLKKQAFSQDRKYCHLNLESCDGSMSTLIIDDVITTGNSIRRLMSEIKEKGCRFLTLSSAAEVSDRPDGR